MKIFLFAAGAVFLILFLLPIFEDVLNFGNIFGILSGICFLILGFAWNKMTDIVQTVFTVLIIAGFIVTAVMLIPIIRAGKTTDEKKNVIIVLGCRVKGDIPSLALVKRVDTAYDYLIKNKSSIAILSGGQGRDENISEAECMKQMLIEKGICTDKLLCEDKSVNTDENIRFSLEIMEKLETEKEAAVATSEYHQKRADMICKRYGIKAVPVSSKTKLTLLPTFLIREIFAVIKEKAVTKM